LSQRQRETESATQNQPAPASAAAPASAPAPSGTTPAPSSNDAKIDPKWRVDCEGARKALQDKAWLEEILGADTRLLDELLEMAKMTAKEMEDFEKSTGWGLLPRHRELVVPEHDNQNNSNSNNNRNSDSKDNGDNNGNNKNEKVMDERIAALAQRVEQLEAEVSLMKSIFKRLQAVVTSLIPAQNAPAAN
jgi:hypothetical protein